VKLSYDGIGSITYIKGRATERNREIFKEFTPEIEGSKSVYSDLEDTTTVCYYITDKLGIVGQPYNYHSYAYAPYRSSDLDIAIVRENRKVYIAKSNNLGYGFRADAITEYNNHIQVDFPVADADLKECLDQLLGAAEVEHALI